MDGTGTVLNIETKYTLDQINNMEISTVPTTLNYPVFQNVTPDDPTSMQIAINTIMADWIDIPQAATSETIEVTNQPASIQIFIQPANTIYVGDPFQVTVKATISSGAPAARVYITAGMQASSDLIEDASSGMQLMFQLAQGSKRFVEM